MEEVTVDSAGNIVIKYSGLVLVAATRRPTRTDGTSIWDIDATAFIGKKFATPPLGSWRAAAAYIQAYIDGYVSKRLRYGDRRRKRP